MGRRGIGLVDMAPMQDEWGPLIPPTQEAVTAQDEWGPLVPPAKPIAPKSKREQAEELIAGMEAAGTMPRVGMWGDTGQAAAREKAIETAGGTGPYLQQMFSGENLGAAGKNLIESVKNLPQGIAGMIGGLATVGPKLAARVTGLNAPGEVSPSMGTPVPDKGILGDISPITDIATFVPNLMKEWAADPAKAMRERGLDTILTVVAPYAGKGIGKLKAKLKAGVLSELDLAPVFKKMEQEMSGPKEWSVTEGAPSSAVEAGLRQYAKRNPDAYNTALRVGGEIQVAGKRMRWDREANKWIEEAPPIKELNAGARPDDTPNLLGLGLQQMTPESMSPAQKAVYDKYMTARQKPGAQYYKPGGKAAPPKPAPPTAEAPPVPELQQKIMSALKEAKPIRRQQEAIYHAERVKRLAAAMRAGKESPGEAGFYAQLKELSGPIDKVEFESIRSKITQPDIDALFKQIENHPVVQGFEKIEAKRGLAKMFGEMGGRVPQPKELELLDTVFGKPFVDTLIEKIPLWTKAKTMGLEIANIPRALMASMDLSFGLRQGVMMAARHPKLFSESFVKQFQWFTSEKAFQNTMAEIKARPNYKLMQESGLALTDLGKDLMKREEPFIGSRLPEKIPLIGAVVRGSNRAYTGFANKLRADVFDSLVKNAERVGLNPYEDIKLSHDIATVVNTASGRGNLGKNLERAAPLLNATFFSPRLMASRLQSLNPAYYIKLEPFARKEALKTLAAFIGSGTTILGLAKLSGATVGLDPRSADFGKIKLGKTRIDVWGGFTQYARLAGQLISGEVVSSTTGKKITLGEGYKPLTRLDIMQRFMEYKTAPIVSFSLDLLRGQGQFGEKYSLTDELSRRFIPMIISDAIDIYKEDPEWLPLSALGALGIGVQTYSRKPTKSTSGKGW